MVLVWTCNRVGFIYMVNACFRVFDFDVYQPRNSKASTYYHCVEETIMISGKLSDFSARRASSSERPNLISAALASGALM